MNSKLAIPEKPEKPDAPDAAAAAAEALNENVPTNPEPAAAAAAALNETTLNETDAAAAAALNENVPTNPEPAAAELNETALNETDAAAAAALNETDAAELNETALNETALKLNETDAAAAAAAAAALNETAMTETDPAAAAAAAMTETDPDAPALTETVQHLAPARPANSLMMPNLGIGQYSNDVRLQDEDFEEVMQEIINKATTADLPANENNTTTPTPPEAPKIVIDMNATCVVFHMSNDVFENIGDLKPCDSFEIELCSEVGYQKDAIILLKKAEKVCLIGQLQSLNSLESFESAQSLDSLDSALSTQNFLDANANLSLSTHTNLSHKNYKATARVIHVFETSSWNQGNQGRNTEQGVANKLFLHVPAPIFASAAMHQNFLNIQENDKLVYGDIGDFDNNDMVNYAKNANELIEVLDRAAATNAIARKINAAFKYAIKTFLSIQQRPIQILIGDVPLLEHKNKGKKRKASDQDILRKNQDPQNDVDNNGQGSGSGQGSDNTKQRQPRIKGQRQSSPWVFSQAGIDKIKKKFAGMENKIPQSLTCQESHFPANRIEYKWFVDQKFIGKSIKNACKYINQL